MKRQFITHSSQEKRACHATSGSTGGCQDVGVRRACGQAPLLGFLLEGRGKAGQAGLGWAILSNFSRLWGIGAVLSCQIPGPAVVRAGGHWPECESACGR